MSTDVLTTTCPFLHKLVKMLCVFLQLSFKTIIYMLNNLKESVLALSVTVISIASFAQTSSIKTVPNGWHLKDQKTNGYYGISLDKAYDFVKGKKSQPVIVAIIDSGIDTTHEDLKSVLWTNPKEIPGNGIDDEETVILMMFTGGISLVAAMEEM